MAVFFWSDLESFTILPFGQNHFNSPRRLLLRKRASLETSYSNKKTIIKHDLIGVHRDGFPYTNIPHKFGISHHFTWGYLGWGPTELSMNSLYHYTDKDYEFATFYHHDFLEDFIAPLTHQKDFRIPKEEILSWIKKRRGSGGIAPRHVGGIWRHKTEKEALEQCMDMKKDDPSRFLGPQSVVIQEVKPCPE